MIKVLITSMLLILATNSTVMAEDHGHTPDVCSTADQTVCAHLGHMSKIDSTSEAQFVAHIMTPEQVSNLKIVLWMPSMDHGSSPVTATQFGVNKYKVTNAYFIMPGQWEVQISFELNQTAHQINIPMNVVE